MKTSFINSSLNRTFLGHRYMSTSAQWILRSHSEHNKCPRPKYYYDYCLTSGVANHHGFRTQFSQLSIVFRVRSNSSSDCFAGELQPSSIPNALQDVFVRMSASSAKKEGWEDCLVLFRPRFCPTHWLWLTISPRKRPPLCLQFFEGACLDQSCPKFHPVT